MQLMWVVHGTLLQEKFNIQMNHSFVEHNAPEALRELLDSQHNTTTELYENSTSNTLFEIFSITANLYK